MQVNERNVGRLREIVMKKVFITQQTMDEVVSHIADFGFAVEYRDNPQAMSPQELAGAVADCSGVLTLLTDRIDATLLEFEP